MASTKIKSPNQSSSKGFLFAVVAVIVVAAVGIGAWVFFSPSETEKAAQDARSGEVSMEVKYNNGIVTLSNNPQGTAKTVDIYEDYSCTYCSQLAQASDGDLEKAVEEGRAIVNIHTLNFLDRDQVGHSTQTMAAAIEAAKSGDASEYWNLRSYMLENYQVAYGKWNDNLASTLADAGFSEDVLAKAKDETAQKEAQDAANGNSKSLEDRIGEVSSPHVFVDGEHLELNPDTTYSTWVSDKLG